MDAIGIHLIAAARVNNIHVVDWSFYLILQIIIHLDFTLDSHAFIILRISFCRIPEVNEQSIKEVSNSTHNCKYGTGWYVNQKKNMQAD